MTHKKGVKDVVSMSKKLPDGCEMRIYYNYLSRKTFYVRGVPETANIGDLYCGTVTGKTTMDEVEKMVEDAVYKKFNE